MIHLNETLEFHIGTSRTKCDFHFLWCLPPQNETEKKTKTIECINIQILILDNTIIETDLFSWALTCMLLAKVNIQLTMIWHANFKFNIHQVRNLSRYMFKCMLIFDSWNNKAGCVNKWPFYLQRLEHVTICRGH